MDGIRYRNGSAIKHFLSSSAAIGYAVLHDIGDYRLREVTKEAVVNVALEWTPDPSSIREQEYPQIFDLHPHERRDMELMAISRHRGWSLCQHDPWLYEGTFDALSRYVLVQACAMIQFPYPTGNEEKRCKAKLDALIFADKNPLAMRRAGSFCFAVCPQVVYFTAPLHAAGWVRGQAATMIIDMIANGDGEQLDAVLKAIPVQSGPRDCTASVKYGLAELGATHG
jgi:hypothetical protein